MLADRIEAKRINAFRRVFALCGMAEGEPVATLSEPVPGIKRSSH